MIFDITTKPLAMRFLYEFTRLTEIEIQLFLAKNTIIDDKLIDISRATAKELSMEKKFCLLHNRYFRN